MNLPRPTETQISIALAERLRMIRPKCFWSHIANESGLPSHIAKRAASIHKAMGKESGLPDLIFLGLPMGFPVYFYEIKRADGVLLPGQKVFRDYCTATGIPYDCVKSDDWLDHFKVIERALKLGGAI